VELRHLRYFIAVAEHLNFSRAAEELQTAQPSLSQQIRALEYELKMTLFERTHRYVALTEEGRLLLPEAREIVQRVDALSTLRIASSDPRGPLRIASITASTIGILPKVLARYRARYPDVDVSVETWALEDDIRALIERRVDVAFVRAPISDRRLDSVLVAQEDICIALPATHPLTSKKKISLAALHGLDLVGMRDELTGGFNEWIAKLLADNDVVVRSVRDTGSIETMLGLIASGMGVAIVSAVLQTLLIKGVVLRPLHPRRSIKNLHLAWRIDRSALPTVRSFREHVAANTLNFTAGG
jgi:DNA-binding transcriptional LysR family regulator